MVSAATTQYANDPYVVKDIGGSFTIFGRIEDRPHPRFHAGIWGVLDWTGLSAGARPSSPHIDIGFRGIVDWTGLSVGSATVPSQPVGFRDVSSLIGMF